MKDQELIRLLKGLADPSRLAILRSLMKEDMYVERLAERLGLSVSTVSFHLKKLEEAGAVSSRKEQYYTVYSLCPDPLAPRVIDLIAGEPGGEDLQNARDSAYRERVVASYMQYGKVLRLPAQLKKKNIILGEIARAFTPGVDYTEKQVNLLIADFYDDFCTARRDMVGAGLLTRRGGVYRRVEDEE